MVWGERQIRKKIESCIIQTLFTFQHRRAAATDATKPRGGQTIRRRPTELCAVRLLSLPTRAIAATAAEEDGAEIDFSGQFFEDRVSRHRRSSLGGRSTEHRRVVPLSWFLVGSVEGVVQNAVR